MLWRLILKLMFKMSLPLVGLLGVLSYGHYLQGGDPGAIWRSVGDGIGTKVTSLFDGARNSVSGLGDTVASVANDTTGDESSATSTRVFTWTDAQGQTHFSQSAPLDRPATSMMVDSRTNVLVGFSEAHRPTPEIRDTHESDGGRVDDPQLRAANGDASGAQPMPGIAGLVSSQNSGGNPAEGVDVQALMKILQAR